MNLAKREYTKSIFRKKRNFCTSTMKYDKKETRKKSLLLSNKKNKVPRNKLNQGGKRPVLRNLHKTEEKIKEDTKKWIHMTCSWTRRIISLKCPYHPKQSIDSMQCLSKY